MPSIFVSSYDTYCTRNWLIGAFTFIPSTCQPIKTGE